MKSKANPFDTDTRCDDVRGPAGATTTAGCEGASAARSPDDIRSCARLMFTPGRASRIPEIGLAGRPGA